MAAYDREAANLRVEEPREAVGRVEAIFRDLKAIKGE